jgi:hypothetical protein
LLGMAAVAWIEHVCENLARPTDGLKSRPAGRRYTGRPRACGGIGRRARLRALWTDWSVEVRVFSGA